MPKRKNPKKLGYEHRTWIQHEMGMLRRQFKKNHNMTRIAITKPDQTKPCVQVIFFKLTMCSICVKAMDICALKCLVHFQFQKYRTHLDMYPTDVWHGHGTLLGNVVVWQRHNTFLEVPTVLSKKTLHIMYMPTETSTHLN